MSARKPNIRLGTENDLPSLNSIEIAAGSLFSEEDIPPVLAQPSSEEELLGALSQRLLWVAEVANERVVGFIVCERVDGCLHISEVDVRPDYGKQGIGTALVQHALAHAQSTSGMRAVTLTTFEHVPWNAPFYMKLGFEVVSDTAHYPHLEQSLARERARGFKNRVSMSYSLGIGRSR